MPAVAIAREVIVISDLHIGGRGPTEGNGRGFRMNTHVAELTAFVVALTKRDDALELVINGDFLDVLAEREMGGAATLDPYSLVDQQVFSDLLERDATLFEAVGAFAAKHRLTIMLGNHDVELALPPFRTLFEKTAGVELGQSVRFVANNEAYVIGDVLIEHGNRYCGFNTIDHDELRRLASALSRGERDERVVFPPPPGSQLVVEIMNAIKRDYPFVDLLKPETCAAIPLLLAFDPAYVTKAKRIATLKLEQRKRQVVPGSSPPRLTNVTKVASPTPRFTGSDLADDIATAVVPIAEAANKRDLEGLREVEDLLGAETTQPVTPSPVVPVSIGSAISQLATFVQLVASSSLVKRMPALRCALRVLDQDRSFVLAAEDDSSPYVGAAQILARDAIRHVIFGHTHLAKQIELGQGRRYINTGTWADLAQLPFEELQTASDEQLAKMFEAFLAALRITGTHDWLKWQPRYAAFHVAEDGTTCAPRLFDAQTRKPLVEDPGG